jgi:TolB-like protein
MANWPLSAGPSSVFAMTVLVISVVSTLATAPPATAAPATTAGGAASAAVAPANRIAVLPLEIIGEVPAGRPALEASVAKGLVVAGMTVVIGPEVGSTLSAAGARVACVDAACWIAAGRALGARNLIAGVVERKGPVFQVEFRLVDATAGREVLKEANHCDVADCSVAELCRLTVHELARAGLSRPSGAAVAATPATAAPVVPAPAHASAAGGAADKSPGSSSSSSGAAAAPGASAGTSGLPASGAPPAAGELSGWSSPSELSAVAPATPVATPFFPRWFPVAAVVGGVVAGGIGGFLIYKDEKCASDIAPGSTNCKKIYHNMVPGVATVAGGAILVASGIVVGLTREDDTAPAVTSLSVGPASIGFGGRF